MIIKTYHPDYLGYTSHYKTLGIDLSPRVPEIIKTSPFPELPSSSLGSSLPNFPKWPELPEIIRTPPSVLPSIPEYPNDWESDPSENSFVTRNITDPIHNWLKGTTKEDVIKFVFENAQDVYEAVTDALEILKELEGDNPNQTFYNAAASETFNGGIGDDTVVYSGKHAEYQIKAVSNILGVNKGYVVTGNNGMETDTLMGIENLEFSDGHSDLNIIGSETFHPLI